MLPSRRTPTDRSTDRSAAGRKALHRAAGARTPNEREAAYESDSVFHTAVETARKLIEEAERPTPRTHVASSAPQRPLSPSSEAPGRPAADGSAETNAIQPAEGGGVWPRKSDVSLGDLVASRVETVGHPIETRLDGKEQLSPAAHPGPRSLPVENSVPVAASLVESLTISTPVSEKRQSAAPVPQPHAPRVREGSKRERPQSPGAPPPRQIDSKSLTLSPATPYDLNPFAGTEFAVHRDTNILHATVDLENYNLSFKVGYEDITRTTPSLDIKSGFEHASGSSQHRARAAVGGKDVPCPSKHGWRPSSQIGRQRSPGTWTTPF